MSNDKNISRRKALATIAGTGAAAAAGGAGTFAYITDSGEADVSLQAGSIVLQVSPETIDFTSETASDGEDNEQDDGDEMTTTITLQNAGTLPAKALHVSSLNLTGNDDLKNNAKVTTLNLVQPGGTSIDALDSGSSPYYGDADDQNGNGFLDLADLKARIDQAPLPAFTSGQQLKPFQDNQLQIELGVTYDYEGITSNGGTLEATFEFTAAQQ